eukprot:6065504-Prorocentrum_lima.AAC.1
MEVAERQRRRRGEGSDSANPSLDPSLLLQRRSRRTKRTRPRAGRRRGTIKLFRCAGVRKAKSRPS